jgi:hypothetical protein
MSLIYWELSTFSLNIRNSLIIFSPLKQAENLFKGCIYDKEGISSVPP